MQCSARFGLLFSVLLLTVPAWTQQTTTPSPQGATVLLESLGAMLGRASLSDLTLTGTANRIAGSDDETGTAVLKVLATGQSRMDFTLPSGQSSEIRSIDSNGNQEGVWIGPNGVSHAIPLHNLMTSTAWFQPALALGGIVSSKNYTVSYSGPDTKDGISVTHLTVTQAFPSAPTDITALMEHLSQMDMFLDTTTHLPVAMDFNIHPDNNALLDIPVEIRYSDYTAVNGVQVPFHIQKYLNNSLALDIQIQGATLNSGLAASAFTIQ
jgi:hypothetical protein